MNTPQTTHAADKHEDWCDQQWCGLTPTGVEHLGRPNPWSVHDGDRLEMFARFELSLHRNDGFGSPGRILAAFWMASVLTDSRVTEGTQVYLTPAQLRSTARRMLAFAALAENVQGGGHHV
jgi:hypothetical protein